MMKKSMFCTQSNINSKYQQSSDLPPKSNEKSRISLQTQKSRPSKPQTFISIPSSNIPLQGRYTISQINFNNKAQFKQKMSQLRVRPIQKPLILQSYIYNHRPQQNQSSPQASFLKLSEKNSTELQAQESSIFADMQNRLARLEEKSVRQICEIQREIKEREHRQTSKPYKTGLIRDKKQGEAMTYRKLQGCAYNMQSFEQQNFQMDENLNYVRDAHNEMNSNLVRDMIQAKGINSEPLGKEPFNLRQMHPCDRNSNSNASRRSSFFSRNQASPCNQREYSQNSSKGKRKLSNSLCKDSKTGSSRIYEQILSNYSTAKLLAMQKKLP